MGRLKRSKFPSLAGGGHTFGGGAGAGLLSATAGRLLCDTYLGARELLREVTSLHSQGNPAMGRRVAEHRRWVPPGVPDRGGCIHGTHAGPSPKPIMCQDDMRTLPLLHASQLCISIRFVTVLGGAGGLHYAHAGWKAPGRGAV